MATVKLWQESTGTETSAQQLRKTIGEKDSVIEEQKALIGKKDKRPRKDSILMKL
jgi:hypothetical protein